MSLLGQGTSRLNNREYEKDKGFVSDIIAVAAGPVATSLWAVGVACIVNPSGVPANGRTAGSITTVYTLIIENPTAGAITAWLEIDGAQITPLFHILATDHRTISFDTGFKTGDNDIDINASVATVNAQIIGLES